RRNPEARQVAVRASGLLREAIREARNIMNDLHPTGLDEFGVVPLIRQELQRFQDATGCQTSFDSGYAARLHRNVEVALYRIFHEALINIGKHAATTTKVIVTLEKMGNSVHLRIQDNGPGFDVDAARRRPGVGGLLSMERRAEIMGGSFGVTSNSGRGTTVTVGLPVASPVR
ncbi:MAG: ATP-binding protein, partial [Dehalococcoidia bacterium]